MAENSNMDLMPVVYWATDTTTTTTTAATATTTTSTVTTTSTTASIISTPTTGRGYMQHLRGSGCEGGLKSAYSFIGFELDSQPAKFISDLRHLVLRGNSAQRKASRERSLSGLNGVMRKGGHGNTPLPLNISENVETKSIPSFEVLMEEGSLENGIRRKSNRVNIESVNVHRKSCSNVEDVCLVSVGGEGQQDSDEGPPEIILVREFVNNDSPLSVLCVQPRKEKPKETETIHPHHCLDNRESQPLVVKAKQNNIYSLDCLKEAEQEGQYHLFGAPEHIEEVVTLEDMEVGPLQVASCTLSSPVSLVALDHSYCSPPQRYLVETFTPPEEENSKTESPTPHTVVVPCDISASLQDSSDREDHEAESPPPGIIGAMFFLQNKGDASSELNSTSTADHILHHPEDTTAVHLQSGSELNSTGATDCVHCYPQVATASALQIDSDTIDGPDISIVPNDVTHQPESTTAVHICSDEDASDEMDGTSIISIVCSHSAVTTAMDSHCDGCADDGLNNLSACNGAPCHPEVAGTLHFSSGDIAERFKDTTTATTSNCIVHHPVTPSLHAHNSGGGRNGLYSAATHSSVLCHADTTSDNVSCDYNKPHQEAFDSDGVVSSEHNENAEKHSCNVFTSESGSKSAKESFEDHKLDFPRSNFYGNGECQDYRATGIDMVNPDSRESRRRPGGGNHESQRAGSQERMMIRSSIQLRKRKIYKLIQVPQRESINYDMISNIDSYYTIDTGSVDDDLPASRENCSEKPPDLFPSIKAEKRAINSVWQVLTTQLENCMRGITTLPPPITMLSRKRKRNHGKGKKRSGGTASQCLKERGDLSVNFHSLAETPYSKTSQSMKGKGELDQTSLTCTENQVSVCRRKSVCFCRYNTVLPSASRRTCCGKRRFKSGCRRSSRSSSREDIAYPTDKNLFFSSLGLMEKSQYDKDVYYKSLVTHRTRKVRANQIKGKAHYRMFLDSLHGYCLDQSSEKLKQPLPLKFISEQKLCKLSTKSKSVDKLSDLNWHVDELVQEHNFEGFGNGKSSEPCSTNVSSPGKECNLGILVDLGDSGSGESNSETLPSLPFCYTDTNDNFTENCSIPRSGESQLQLSRNTADVEKCPVCEKSSDKVCSLDHKTHTQPLSDRIPGLHTCQTLPEKGHSSLVIEGELLESFMKNKKMDCEVEDDEDEDCYGGTLLDTWSESQGEFSTLKPDGRLEEMKEDAPAHTSKESIPFMPGSDVMEVDNDDSSNSSLPDLWLVGEKKIPSIHNALTAAAAAASPCSDEEFAASHTTCEHFEGSAALCKDESEDCDFLGFDNESYYLGYKTITQECVFTRENTTTSSKNTQNKDIFGKKSNLQYLDYQKQLAQLPKQHGSMGASKDLGNLSCSTVTPKVSEVENYVTLNMTNLDTDKCCNVKPSKVSTISYINRPQENGEAGDSVMDCEVLQKHTEFETKTLTSLSAKGTSALRASVSPTLLSHKRKKEMATKLLDLDLTRNCRVSLTKLQIPESALEGIKIDTEGSIARPLFSGDLSPEKLIKKAKTSESVSCVTLSRSSERLNVQRIKYSELLKPSMRRSLNGMGSKEIPLSPHAAKHARSISDGTVLKCSVCLLTFRSKGALSCHLETHEAEKEFMCVECGLSFPQKLQLQSHMKLHSSARQIVSCEKCGTCFSQLEDLRSHVKNHLSPKSRACSLTCKCETTVSDPLRVDFKDNDKKCVQCSRTFVVTPTLRRHTRTHNRGKLHHCALCTVDASLQGN